MGSVTRWLRPLGGKAIRHYRRLRNLPEDHRRYRENKRHHLELLPSEPGPGPDPKLLHTIHQDGVAVVREFVPREVAEAMAAELRATMEVIAADRYEGPLPTRRDDDDGVYRLFAVDDTLAPSTRKFFRSPFIAGIADAQATPGVHVADSYVDYKNRVGGHDPSVEYHIDHWKLRFKAFLLLADVSEEGAPLIYVAGSHRGGSWRRHLEWAYQRGGARRAVFGPRSAARIIKWYGYEERVVTGHAGDLIFANTRGMHRGTELQHGTRLQLVNLFVMNGSPDYAC
jgi:Phytanoyl-CoA dioxygenase (PhyH)